MKRSVILTDRLGPEYFASVKSAGQVLHRFTSLSLLKENVEGENDPHTFLDNVSNNYL